MRMCVHEGARGRVCVRDRMKTPFLLCKARELSDDESFLLGDCPGRCGLLRRRRRGGGGGRAAAAQRKNDARICLVAAPPENVHKQVPRAVPQTAANSQRAPPL